MKLLFGYAQGWALEASGYGSGYDYDYDSGFGYGREDE